MGLCRMPRSQPGDARLGRGAGAAPLTSGSRSTLQYFTPLRSLRGGSEQERLGARPSVAAEGPAEHPSHLDASARSGSNSGGTHGKYMGHRRATEAGNGWPGRSPRKAHTYFLHRSQLYMLSPRAVK